jgi:glycolate oxidase iron-sulfur subunit
LRLRVAYQDACHLRTPRAYQPPRPPAIIPGIKIAQSSRSGHLLRQRQNLQSRQPDTAEQLGDRKARLIDSTRPDIVATANPGCTLQLRAAASRAAHHWPIRHPIELLDASLRGVEISNI